MEALGAEKKPEEAPESASPEFDLAKVWDALPASGPFQVAAEAVDSGGKRSPGKFLTPHPPFLGTYVDQDQEEGHQEFYPEKPREIFLVRIYHNPMFSAPGK